MTSQHQEGEHPQGSSGPTEERVIESALALERSLRAAGFVGWDPYDALTSRVLRTCARSPLARRFAIQSLKRSPVNFRPWVGVRPFSHTKALALLVSAYARLARRLPPGHAEREALALAATLSQRAIRTTAGLGLGYDFDVQTRWGYYRRGEPNSIVTAFVAHALADLQDWLSTDSFSPFLRETRQFMLKELLHQDGRKSYFSYYPGSPVAIHNANALVASVIARTGRQYEVEQARSAIEYCIASQRPDGSWVYGDANGLDWIDGFHTAYVLWGLLAWHNRDPDMNCWSALSRGVDFYLENLIDPDGGPRASTTRRFPLDIHAAASAIWVLGDLRRVHVAAADKQLLVLTWALEHMRRGDGRFAYQLHRSYRNSTPYIRWNDGHMLLALATALRETA